MFGLVTRAGFNEVKPAVATRLRLMKAYDVRRVRPSALAMGSSRVLIGIRMTHPGWNVVPVRRRYNLAFDAATPDEIFAYLQHAEAIRPLRLVVIGLDSWWLTDGPIRDDSDFDPSILARPGALGAQVGMHFLDARLLLSLDTFEASLRTIGGQDGVPLDTIRADGQRDGAAFFYRPGSKLLAMGQGRFFDANDAWQIAFKVPHRAPKSPRIAPAADPPPATLGLDEIAEIVAFCREHAIDLRLFITPEHAHLIEASRMVGEWPRIDVGKRRLVQLLAEDAARHPGLAPIPLWDFSGYSSVTTEAVPGSNDPREMRYYWEASHFKPIVGDFILDRVFGVDVERVPSDFGRRIDNVSDVDAMIAAERRAHARYAATHPADLSKLRSDIARARASAP